ncbi:multiple epidermal growth factor-like domains protein 10 isoform X4 [Crassostrea angulata]|uniref:multiple epidermal growth factor-like domains protein 10 isoform X4 n=1 Tax=Magallana angulata TaxID=2784310 RepID=UPI0022B18BD9|nr:multiple epidermal growth factor-like domains protein 10 isoform X4 [Crassostrea angulata]
MDSIVVILLTSVHILEAVDNGNCFKKTGVCCKNYVLHDGKCTECPAGTYGYNCTMKCPVGYYGILCTGRCNCFRNETCHPLEGCTGEPEYFISKYDKCKAGEENKTNNGCCVNQRKKGEICTDCWTGYFGENCEKNCLQDQERFGRFCLERCNCNPKETCHVNHGCQGEKETTSQTKGFINDVHHFNTYNEYGISSETRSGVPKVEISEYPTLQRELETGIQIELEAYSTFSDFKTCSKV